MSFLEFGARQQFSDTKGIVRHQKMIELFFGKGNKIHHTENSDLK